MITGTCCIAAACVIIYAKRQRWIDARDCSFLRSGVR